MRKRGTMLAAPAPAKDGRVLRVLVAGCGDVGSRAASLLHARGAQVYGLRRSVRALPVGITPVQADLTDPHTLADLPRDIDQLVYLPTPGARTPEAYRRIFVDGLDHLLDALEGRPPGRVIFVSSSAVYGDHGGDWVDEDTPPDPPGFNGEILLEAERRLAARGLPSTVLRLAGLYGPGRLGLVERLRAGRATAPVDPPFWANRIHVDDAAAAIVHLLALSDPAPLYLGVDDAPQPIDQLYGTIAACVGAPAPGQGSPPRGIGNKRLSNARLRASGFVPGWPDALAGYRALLAGD